MITLQITNNSPEAMRFLEHARSLPYIREKKSKQTTSEHIPGLAYTHEERLASVAEGMEDIRAGRVVSNKEMGKWVDGLQ